MSAPALLLPRDSAWELTPNDIKNFLLSADRGPVDYLPKSIAARKDLKCPAKLLIARMAKVAGSSTEAQISNLDLAQQTGSKQRTEEAQRKYIQRQLSKTRSAKVIKNVLQGPHAAKRQFIKDDKPLKVFDISDKAAWAIPGEMVSSTAFKARAKLLYGVVAAHARISGAAFMQRKTMAGHLHCSVETVDLCLAELVAGKVLQPAGKRGRVNVYKLLYHDMFRGRFWPASPPKDRTPFTTKDRTLFTTKDKVLKIQASYTASAEVLVVGSSFSVSSEDQSITQRNVQVQQTVVEHPPGLIDFSSSKTPSEEQQQPPRCVHAVPTPASATPDSRQLPTERPQPATALPKRSNPCFTKQEEEQKENAEAIETASKQFSQAEHDVVAAAILQFGVFNQFGVFKRGRLDIPIEVTIAKVLIAGNGASAYKIADWLYSRFDDFPNHPDWEPPKTPSWFETVIKNRWPEGWRVAQCDKRRSEFEEQPRAKLPTFDVEEVRQDLESNAKALKSRPEYAAIGDKLQQLADDAETQYLDLEALEQKLTALEGRCAVIAKESLSGEALLAARRELDTALKPYRSKMTEDQLANLERQFMEKRALEFACLPRLSLFYLRT